MRGEHPRQKAGSRGTTKKNWYKYAVTPVRAEKGTKILRSFPGTHACIHSKTLCTTSEFYPVASFNAALNATGRTAAGFEVSSFDPSPPPKNKTQVLEGII